MPRIARMIIPDEKTVYHVMSRTALDGYPFGDAEKGQKGQKGTGKLFIDTFISTMICNLK